MQGSERAPRLLTHEVSPGGPARQLAPAAMHAGLCRG